MACTKVYSYSLRSYGFPYSHALWSRDALRAFVAVPIVNIFAKRRTVCNTRTHTKHYVQDLTIATYMGYILWIDQTYRCKDISKKVSPSQAV